MKKLFLLLIPVFFLVTSCDLLFDIFLGDGSGSGNTFTQIVEVDESGDVYLVQVNNTKNNSFSAKISDIQQNYSRSENINLQNIKIENQEYIFNDTSFVNKFLNDINISDDFSRAANNSGIVTSEIIKNKYNDGETKYFYVALYENNKEVFKQKKATLITSNDACNVWYIEREVSEKEKANNTLTDYNEAAKAKCKDLADKFKILQPYEESYFNSHIYDQHSSMYINPQEKIDIIVTDIFGDAYNDQRGGTLGYFYSADYIDSSIYTSIASNNSQCIYIDSFFLNIAHDNVYSTLLHEYAHLLEFTQKKVINGLNVNLNETWYSEMLAMQAEDLFYNSIGLEDKYSPVSRLPYFLLGSNYGFTNWESGDNVYYSYANAYVYGAYLIRNYGGSKLLKEIWNNNYLGEESITAALKKVMGNEYTFESTVKNEWQILFPNSKDLTYSLNKEIKIENSSNLKFINIDISNIRFYYQDGNLFTLNNIHYNQNFYKNINPQGFYICYVGKNVSSYSITGYDDITYFSFVNN